MRGAPVRAIQDFAGHQEIGTTQRYLHLSPAAIASAIGLLERRERVSVGDMLETALTCQKRAEIKGDFGCGGGI